MDFKLSIKETKLVLNLFKTLSEFIGDIKIKIDHGGFYISSMDSAEVAIVDLYIAKTDFDVFELNDECEFGINLIDVYKMMKNIKDIIIFEGLKDNKLKISAKSEKKKNRSLSLRTIDVKGVVLEHDLIDERYIDSTQIQIFKEELDAIIKDAELYTDFVNIDQTMKYIKFYSQGSQGEMNTELYPESCIYFNYKNNQTGQYSIKYLQYFTAFDSSQLQIALCDDDTRAMRIKYEFLQNSSLSFILAARVDDSNDFMRDA